MTNDPPQQDHDESLVSAPSDASGTAHAEETAGVFDAVAAAAELAASLDSDPVTDGVGADVEARLEAEVLELDGLLHARDLRIAELEVEVDAARARVKKEAEKSIQARVDGVLMDVLELVDDLDRALSAAREMDHNPAVIAGVELVHRATLQRLAARGVTRCDAAGQKFDPQLHDAVTMMPVADAAQDGLVVAVVREGYLQTDRVLRPAQVVVGRKV